MIRKISGANYRMLWQLEGEDIFGYDFFSLECARECWEVKKQEFRRENKKMRLEPIIRSIRP